MSGGEAASFFLPGDPSHDEGQMLARMLGEILVGPLAGVAAGIDPEPGYRRTFGGRGERDEPAGVTLARAAADADLLVVGFARLRERQRPGDGLGHR